MIIKRTIKYSIQNQRNAGSRLRMRVSYNGCRVDFQTGIVLNKEYWDDVQQRVLPLNSNVVMATDLNDQLSQDKHRDLEEKGSKDAEVLLKITSNQDRLNQSFSMINSVLSLITVAFIADMIRDSDFIMDNISMKTCRS